MQNAERNSSQVTARVTEVLPTLGLAYLTDEHFKGWTVTKSTSGPGLSALRPAKRVNLTVAHHAHFSLATQHVQLN